MRLSTTKSSLECSTLNTISRAVTEQNVQAGRTPLTRGNHQKAFSNSGVLGFRRSGTMSRLVWLSPLAALVSVLYIWYRQEEIVNVYALPIVKLDKGTVEGSFMKATNGRVFYAFRGLPFAKPPTGDLRFQPPEPEERWSGVLDATDNQVMCYQKASIMKIPNSTMSEDCLYLNVYTPQLLEYEPTGVDLLPVLVFIHGGGYTIGTGISNMYGPQRLMSVGSVLFVTLNYRVDAFGYLSTGDSVAPGNYGMLDQARALQWLQENIVRFGGDPNAITIFGESAGASSVVLHMLSPLSKGLFHRAIVDSGSALCDYSLEPMPLTAAKKFAESKGCPSSVNQDLVNCLRKIKAKDLIEEDDTLIGDFVPVIDGTGKFLPAHPKHLLETGNFNKVPVIIGFNLDEGMLFYFLKPKLMLQLNSDTFENFVLDIITKDSNFLEPKKVTSALAVEYLKEVNLDDTTEVKNAYIKLIGDHLISMCTFETVQHLAKEVPTFFYHFTYPKYSILNGFGLWNMGVSHADDLLYLFKGPFSNSRDPEDFRNMSSIFINYFVSFTKNGVPTLPPGTYPQSTTWQAVDKTTLRYLQLDDSPEMIEGHTSIFSQERIHFWKELAKFKGQQRL